MSRNAIESDHGLPGTTWLQEAGMRAASPRPPLSGSKPTRIFSVCVGTNDPSVQATA